MAEEIKAMTDLWIGLGIGSLAFLWCLGLGIKHYLEGISGYEKDE